MKILMIITAILILTITASCTKPEETKTILTKQGYTNIQIGGYSLFACSKGDFYSTKFNATSANGSNVSGTVCSGIFKGSTVRFD